MISLLICSYLDAPFRIFNNSEFWDMLFIILSWMWCPCCMSEVCSSPSNHWRPHMMRSLVRMEKGAQMDGLLLKMFLNQRRDLLRHCVNCCECSVFESCVYFGHCCIRLLIFRYEWLKLCEWRMLIFWCEHILAIKYLNGECTYIVCDCEVWVNWELK